MNSSIKFNVQPLLAAGLLWGNYLRVIHASKGNVKPLETQIEMWVLLGVICIQDIAVTVYWRLADR